LFKSISELSNLKNRRALITGATGHLGQTISLTLADLNCNLILVDKNKDGLNKLKLKLKNNDIKIDVVVSNLEIEVNRNTLIKNVYDKGNLDILINNAAFVGDNKLDGWNVSFENQSLETWRRAFEVNLTAIFHLSQKLSALLKLSKNASIINIASIYGIYGPDFKLYENTDLENPAAYSASKGGLIQLTRWLATSLAPNIRVNSISPGGIQRNQPKSFKERYISKTPLKRMAVEDDFIGIIAFLASDMSRYVTGQNISVDGGWGVW